MFRSGMFSVAVPAMDIRSTVLNSRLCDGSIVMRYLSNGVTLIWRVFLRSCTGNDNCYQLPMLGLRRTEIRVVPYQSSWAQAYEDARADILRVSAQIEMLIEHIGSTSVPGLMSKPIVDIGILLSDPDRFTELRSNLASIGWIYRGDKGSGGGGRLLVLESEPEVRTHHLHVHFPGATDWRRYLAFRDSLRVDHQLRLRYGLLKMDLAERFHDDRMRYTEAKTDFVEQALLLDDPH